MLLTLKCFLPRLNAIKEFATSISSLTLHTVNLLLWKKILSLTLFKINTVSRPSALQNFPYGDIILSKGNGRGGPPTRLKVWTFPFCWISPPVLFPSPNLRPHIRRKVSLIVFRQILPKTLSAVHIFSNTIMSNLKKLIWNKPLNKKQFPAGLSPRIIP